MQNIYFENRIFKKVIHLADIHIRTGDANKCRYSEYQNVFNNLYKKLRKIVDEWTLIIICGDLTNDKSKIEDHGIKLFYNFIENLMKLSPVCLFNGNHDFLRLDMENSDILQALLIPYDKSENIIYLSKSGNYKIGNLGIGIIVQRDILKNGDTSGHIAELPEFPSANNLDTEYKIALFHGTMIKSRLQNYKEATSEDTYPISWFNGYDIGILGDIHLQQIHNAEQVEDGDIIKYRYNEGFTWGYSGSLIQQNFGESIYTHGFLEWNLENKEIKCYHVRNKYGQVYIKYDERWMCKITNEWIDMESAYKKSSFPDILYVKIYENIFNISGNKINELYALSRKYNKKINLLGERIINRNKSSLNIDIDLFENIDKNKININEWNKIDKWIEYLKKKEISNEEVKWENYLNDLNNLKIMIEIDRINDKCIIEKIEKQNKEIDCDICIFNDLYGNNINKTSKNRLKLKYMKWGWILCYGENNYINFDTLDKNIVCINAKNNTGKSAFFETICLALHGQSMKSRSVIHGSACIICDQRPKTAASASTDIEFLLGERTYRVYRSFEKHTTGNLSSKRVELYENNRVIYSGSEAVNKWIKDNIGDINDFLLACMFTQNNDADFFNQSAERQMEIFDANMDLKSFYAMNILLKTSIAKHESCVKEIQKIKDVKFSERERDNLENNKKQIEELNEEIIISDNEILNIKQRIERCNRSYREFTEEELNGELNKEIENISNDYNDYSIKQLNELENNLINKKNKLIENYKYEYKQMGYSINKLEGMLNKMRMEIELDDNELYKMKQLKDELDTLGNYVDGIDYMNIQDAESKLNLLKKERLLIEYNGDIKDIKQVKYEYKEIKKKICDRYNNIEDYMDLYNKYGIEPNISKEMINIIERGLEDDRNKIDIDYKYLYDCDESIFIEEKHNIVKEINRMKECIRLDEDELNKLYKIIEENKRFYIIDIDECNRRIEKYIELEREYNSNKKIWKRIRANIDKFNKENDKIEELKDKRIKISEYIILIKNKNHPYNENCESCNRQYWRIDLIEKEKEVSYIEAEIDKLQKKINRFNMNKINKEIELKNKIEYVDNKEENYDRILEYKEQEVNRERLKILHYSISINRQELDKLQNIERIIYYCENKRDEWKKNRELVNKYKLLWERYERIKDDIYLRDEYLEKLNKYNKIDLKKKADELDNEINKYNEYIDKIKKYLIWREKKNEYEIIYNKYEKKIKQIERIKVIEYNILNKRINDVSNVKISRLSNAIINYIKNKELKEDLEREIIRCGELKAKVNELKNNIDRINLINNETMLLHDSICKLNKKIEIIKKIYDAFKSFRKWIYESVIIEKLLMYSNNVIKMVTDDDSLKLKCNIEGDLSSEKNGYLNWQICHDKSIIHYKKASASQISILGFAIRMSLVFLGTNKIFSDQLFIDESFINLDSIRIKRIPALINNISSIFNTIIIVSHLDIIKEACNKHIYIERDDGKSYIRFDK